MKKTVICEKVLTLGGGEKCTLTYYLVAENCREDNAVFTRYGVGISIPEKNEDEFIRDLTAKEERAMRLLDLLASNFVTPVGLHDVLCDWICT